MFAHQLDHPIPELVSRTGGKTDEHHAQALVPGRECQPPKVLVIGEKDPAFANRKLDYLFVFAAGQDLSHGNHIETLSPQSTNDGEIATLVKRNIGRLSRY